MMKQTYKLSGLTTLFLFFALLYSTTNTAQIFNGEGLNMPGSWNGWTNPASNNLAIASATQVAGGRLAVITTGTQRYQTIFNASGSGDFAAGAYEFKFTSGPSGSPYANEWAGGVGVTLNTIQTYNQGGANCAITLNNNKWYIMNWRDQGYNPTQAIFMEISGAPVNINTVTQSPTNGNIYDTDPVAVSITTSAAPAADERIYVRYSTNGFTTSSTVQASFTGNVGTATIPVQAQGANVSYYVFSSSIVNPTSDFDMQTIRFNNNGGSNYSYTVESGIPPVDITFQVDLSQQTISGNGVHIAGSFQGWNPAGTPMNSIGGGIYQYTGSFIPGASIQYKFINGNAWGTDETVSGACTSGGNRTLIIPAVNTTLPLACFASCDACVPPPSPVNVTFQLNLGAITPSVNGVHIAGSFQGWNPGSTPMVNQGGGIYTYTTAIIPGEIQYKFINGNDWPFEEFVPAGCATGGNRTYTVTTAASVPQVCFGSCTDCPGAITSAASGNWDSPATWTGGVVPPAGSDVVISSGHNVTLNVNAQVTNFTINAGGALTGSDGSPRTLTIQFTGAFTNNGTFSPTANNTILFEGFNAVNGTVAFNNVTLSGGANFGLNSTVNGTLRINAGGFVDNNPPVYGVNSILQYSTNGIYGRGAEWSSNTGAGFPRNIEIINFTAVHPGANGGAAIARIIGGNLTIANGSGLFMGASGNEMTASITLNGNLNLSGELSLSSQIGGDFAFRGNVTLNAGSTFVPNGRAVNFNGTTAQTVSGALPMVFYNFVAINNNAGVTWNVPTTVVNDLFVSSGNLDANASLTLQNGGTLNSLLRINSGVTLFVEGGTLNTTFGSLRLESSASLMHGASTPGGGGSVNGNVVVRRTGYNGIRYNFWSSPIQNGTISMIGGTVYEYNPNLGTIDTSDDTFDPGWVTASGALEQGKGYAKLGGGTVTFTGTAGDGPIPAGVLAASAPNTPFNLIGNPYPSAINANQFIASNGPLGSNRITGSIYFWDDDNSAGSDYAQSDYAVWNGAGTVGGGGNTPQGFIASGQGFIVEAQSSGNVNFTNNMRSNQNSQFFESFLPATRLKLAVSNQHDDYNEALIAFLPDATDARDMMYDALKLKGNSDLSLYSYGSDNQEFAIQGLPTLNGHKSVSIGLDAAYQEEHLIRVIQSENIPSTVLVFLEDRETNVWHNLSVNPTYAFTPGQMPTANRFIIHFSAAIELQAMASSCLGVDGKITLENPSQLPVNGAIVNSNNEVVESFEGVGAQYESGLLLPGAYNVRLELFGGILAEQSILVEAGEQLQFELSAASISVEAGETFTLSTLTNGNVTWNMGDGALYTEIDQVAHMFIQPGIYLVDVLSRFAHCEERVTIPVTVSARTENPTATADLESAGFTIYPNPANEQFLIQFSDLTAGAKRTYQLLDVTGKIIDESTGIDQTFVVPSAHIANGVYLMRVTVNGNVHTKPLIIAH